MDKQISDNVIQRLPKYYRCLQELTSKNVQRVSSRAISESLKITASQVRQDFSLFGGFGQQGYGYDTEYLKNCIRDILGLNDTHNAIVIGGGRIGQALVNYKGFSGENINIRAVFDLQTEHIKVSEEIEVLKVDKLGDYLKENVIDIAIICVQKDDAEKVAQSVINYGIKAIWNFAPIDLDFGNSAVCENINMSESLMRLIYRSKI